MPINPAENAWGSDVPVSMPEPIVGDETGVDMGSHVFLAGGLRHNLTQADIDEAFRPTYAPPGDS